MKQNKSLMICDLKKDYLGEGNLNAPAGSFRIEFQAFMLLNPGRWLGKPAYYPYTTSAKLSYEL